jgi:hypothetical protein
MTAGRLEYRPRLPYGAGFAGMVTDRISGLFSEQFVMALRRHTQTMKMAIFCVTLKIAAGNVIPPPHHNWIPIFIGMVFNWILAYFLSNYPSP